MVPYLLIADLQNTVLSAILVFSDRVLYPSYASQPSLFGFPPRDDQAAAGAIMWVVGSLVFIVPAILIAIECLSRRKLGRTAALAHRNVVSSGDRSESGSSNSVPAHLLWGRLNPQSLEVIAFLLLFALTAVGFVALSQSSADDDDQVLRFSHQSGSLVIAVYGPAGDIPVGPARFAVLVQDSASRQALLDSEVDLVLHKTNDAVASPQTVRASPGDENKLLFSADLDTDSEGAWNLEVHVRHASETASLSLPIEIAKPETEFALPWSYSVVFAVVAVLGLVYGWRHMIRKPAPLAAPLA